MFAALTAQAQPTPPPTRADPLDPEASVPALVYTSPLEQYRRLRDEKPAEPVKAWREANDTVARIGGWRAYAREAQQAEPASAAGPALPASAPAAAAPGSGDMGKPMPAGHGGHKP